MRIPAVLTLIPRKISASVPRLRSRGTEAPTGMGQIEAPPAPDLEHRSAEFAEPETPLNTTSEPNADQIAEQADNGPEQQFPYHEAAGPTPPGRRIPSRKVLVSVSSSIISAVIVAAAIGMWLLSGDEATPDEAPISINLPTPEPTAPPAPTATPEAVETPRAITVAPSPTLRPTLPPPPTLTPTPLPPTPTRPPVPTYAPPTATPEPTPTPRNLRHTDHPPHVVCVKYTLDDRPQRGVTIRLVNHQNRHVMLGRAETTDEDGVACLQTPRRSLDENAVPVVAGWAWEPADGSVILTGNQSVRRYLEVKRCTGAPGHLPVIRASGEFKCPYKQ